MKLKSFLVLERDSKLMELDTRADALQAGAAQFETNATSLQRKFWWQNMKMNLIIGGVIVIGKFLNEYEHTYHFSIQVQCNVKKL